MKINDVRGRGVWSAGASALLLTVACTAGDNFGFGGGGGAGGVKAGAGSMNGFGSGNVTSGGPVNNCNADDCVKEGEQQPCDDNIAIDSPDGMDGARAIGLCKSSNGGGWGVVSATYTTANGLPLVGDLALGRGVLSRFGASIVPREGQKLLALSSGAARTPADPGYASPDGFEKSGGFPHAWPSGFTLQESPKCPGTTTGEPYDSAMLEVKIKTPTNAKSLGFDLDFYTYEFPGFICSRYNDYFVALMSPPPEGSIQSNISFDAQGNFISVNAGFLQACDTQVASNGENFPCGLGYGEITGSGYDDSLFPPFPGDPRNSAATSWLQTVAPIASPGAEITLRFAIWDSGDEVLDSTILIDNFRFSLDEGTTGTNPVPK